MRMNVIIIRKHELLMEYNLMKHDPKPRSPAHNNCTLSRLAESSIAAVDVCRCGMMRLHVGAVTLRMAPCAISELLATLGRAIAVQATRGCDPAHADASDLLVAGRGRGDA